MSQTPYYHIDLDGKETLMHSADEEFGSTPWTDKHYYLFFTGVMTKLGSEIQVYEANINTKTNYPDLPCYVLSCGGGVWETFVFDSIVSLARFLETFEFELDPQEL